MSGFCRVCHGRQAEIKQAQDDVRRLAQRAARMPVPSERILTLLDEAKARVDRQRKAAEDHYAWCEVVT